MVRRALLDQIIRLAQMFNNDRPNEVLGAQDRLAEDREILDAYAQETIRSRLPSDVGVGPVPEAGQGTKRTRWIGSCKQSCATISPRSSARNLCDGVARDALSPQLAH